MIAKRTIEIEPLQVGQPRPYADSSYESILTFTTEGENKTWIPDEKEVRKIAKVLVHDFKDEPNWHEPHLKEMERLADNKWRVLVVSAFLD